jgi:hypothetical protein
MAKHDYILTAGRQDMLWQCANSFPERNLFVTGNLIRWSQFFAKVRSGRESFSLSQIRRAVSFTGQIRLLIQFKNRVFRFFDDRRKVCANTVSDAKRQFHCRIAKSPLDEAQHGFGNARTLRDRIIGKSPADALLAQEPDNFMANRFVVADTRHAEAWQRMRFDIYFAMVKHRRLTKPGIIQAKIEQKEIYESHQK